MKKCTFCNEVKPMKSPKETRCKECVKIRKKLNLGDSKFVEISVCDKGHKYIPIKGKCARCLRGENADEVLLSITL